MSDAPRHRIDPTAEELESLLPEGLDRAALAAAARRHPSGVFAQRRAGAGCAVVCWWPDALRRLHWWVGGGPYLRHAGRSHLLGDEAWVRREGPAGETAMLPSHPLERIAPLLTSGWREKGGRREFVVVCRCGVAGPPESLAWMGRTCGPCHDREQEGLPPAIRLPAAPDLAPWPRPLWTPSGWLVSSRLEGGDWDPELEPPETVVDGYAPPWGGWPTWQLSRAGHQPVAAGGEVVAVGGDDGIELADVASGRTLAALAPSKGPALGMTFAGPGRRSLVVMLPGRLAFWHPHTGGLPREPTHVTRLRGDRGSAVFASPDGARVAAFTVGGIEVYDVASGRAVERLAASGVNGSGALADDGCLFASGGNLPLSRWGPATPAAPGLLARWFGPPARRPDVKVKASADSVALTPCGRWVLTVGGDGALALRDPRTLAVHAAFTPGLGVGASHPTFGPEGELLVGTAAGLAVWPWRELFGVG